MIRTARPIRLALVAVAAMAMAACQSGSSADSAPRFEPDRKLGAPRSISPKLVKATQPSADDPASLEGYGSIKDYLEAVTDDVHYVWDTAFEEAGYNSSVYTEFPETTDQVPACGDAESPGPAFYCPGTDELVIAQDFAAALWNGELVGPDDQAVDGPIGDFAVAVVAAHEYGHNVQAELGLEFPDGAHLEQHADCLAGVWANTAAQRGLLEPNDLTEGAIATWLVGDSNVDSPQHHGNSAERLAAIVLGYSLGDPEICNSVYQAMPASDSGSAAAEQGS